MAELEQSGWVTHLCIHEQEEAKRKEGGLGSRGAATRILIPGPADMRGRFGGRAWIGGPSRLGGDGVCSLTAVSPGPAQGQSGSHYRVAGRMDG